ncbi:hypothetical protein BDV93DRAFT_514073 [Ceratobasidium sp. AG-I]|nr:hypothetical protein BDV93DRAFT_514073 [Ceratobasidium sp. AG-I]
MTENRNKLLESSLGAAKTSAICLGKSLTLLREQATKRALLVAQNCSVIQQKDTSIRRLPTRNRFLERKSDALRKRIARRQAQKARNSPSRSLKDAHGAFLPEVRDLVRQLASEQVSTTRIGPVIRYVAQAFGLEVVDSLSARSVSRIMLEGLLQSKIQIAMEINNTSSKPAIYGRGIKNQQHEARLIRMPVAPYPYQEISPDVSGNPTAPPLHTLGV